ncbi:MAG: PaaI family thioesterase [Firmicutes bacterium]|nr:PaaI family thioesterase [Bacillota bacterium]
MQLQDNGRCFACGSYNPIGLRLEFKKAGSGRVACCFTPRADYQGYAGITHGGIISTVLDEAMAHAIISQGIGAVTASMEVRFKAPVPIGSSTTVEGLVREVKERLIRAEARLTLPDGTVAAEAVARFVRID